MAAGSRNRGTRSLSTKAPKVNPHFQFSLETPLSPPVRLPTEIGLRHNGASRP
jgi:hypothetical protein